MTEISRRDAIVMGGAALATAAWPPEGVSASPDVSNMPPETAEVFAKVQDYIKNEAPAQIKEIMGRAQYARIFETETRESLAQKGIKLDGDVEWFAVGGTIVQVGKRPYHGDGFQYNFELQEFDLAYTIPRRAPPELIKSSMLGLIKAFKEYREVQAFDVLDQALVYNPQVGGNGQPLCSDSHPLDRGTFSNAFPVFRELSPEAILDGCKSISAFKTAKGEMLKAAPLSNGLLVPIRLMEKAERFTKSELRPGGGVSQKDANGYMVSDYLECPESWFIRTNQPGLVRVEDAPLRLTAYYDEKTDTIFVSGKENGCFGCYNPMAIFGSVTRTPRARTAYKTSQKLVGLSAPWELARPTRGT